MILLSFVIPAYNVERHISSTLASLLKQPDDRIEIIVVNDGSTDRTEEVAHDFFRTHSHLNARVLTQPNAGVSSARNAGLEQASGAYVVFLDGDDYISDRFINRFEAVINKYSRPQIVHWPYDLVNEQGAAILPFPYQTVAAPQSGIDTLDAIILHRKTRIWTGSVAYRRDFLANNRLYYTVGCAAGEDLEFTFKALSHADSVVFSDGPRSYYVQRSGSVMGSYNIRKFDAVQAMDRLSDHFASLQDPAFSALAKRVYDYDALHFYVGTYRMCLQRLVDVQGLSVKSAVRQLDGELDQAYPGMRRHVTARMSARKKRGLPDKIDIFRRSPHLYLSLSRWSDLRRKQQSGTKHG